MTTPSLRSRVLLVDLLKAGAAQLIVLHHLIWYGLLAEPTSVNDESLAQLMNWLSDYGRYAVAVFVVTGGFLAAQSLPINGLPAGETPGCLIRERYFRLVLPFAALLVLEIVCDGLARQWLNHASLDNPPELLQFLAHVLMLQGVLGVESLSAGVWYVAIDFQLYALLVLLLWLGQKLPDAPAMRRGSAILVALVAAASLFHFNRDARWDAFALYFFGSYGLGVFSGWAIRSENRKPMLWALAVVGLLALSVDFRARIAIALAIALALGSSRMRMTRWEVRFIHYLGRTSYALFLVHFPVYEIVAAVFGHFFPGMPGEGLPGLGITWAVSMIAAEGFHRWVELPLGRFQKRTLQCRPRKGREFSVEPPARPQ